MFARLSLAAALAFAVATSRAEEPRFLAPLDVKKIPHISTDKSIKYDYDIVYVRPSGRATRSTSAISPTSRSR